MCIEAPNVRGRPADELAFPRVLDENGARVLTYGSPAGFLPLREWIAGTMNAGPRAVSAENIAITPTLLRWDRARVETAER